MKFTLKFILVSVFITISSTSLYNVTWNSTVLTLVRLTRILLTNSLNEKIVWTIPQSTSAVFKHDSDCYWKKYSSITPYFLSTLLNFIWMWVLWVWREYFWGHVRQEKEFHFCLTVTFNQASTVDGMFWAVLFDFKDVQSRILIYRLNSKPNKKIFLSGTHWIME